MRSALETIFWCSAGLLVYTLAVYPLLVALFARRPRHDPPQLSDDDLPTVSLIIAAYQEQSVIADKVANSLALDYPREKLEVLVACDGSPDDTPQIAKQAGADIVLELPHGGKMAAQNAAVERASGELLAFSDANTVWSGTALRTLAAAVDAADTGYVCGQVKFVNQQGTNQEGLYWRYEMWLRTRESWLQSVTAGNGAIYVVDRDVYRAIAPETGHDLTLPFNVVKRGRKALYEPSARAEEAMVPSVEGEFKRKRRMMSFAWPIILGGGMLNPRGYGAVYSWMIFSHRFLRYAAPLLHLTAFITAGVLAFEQTLYLALFVAQLLLLLGAVAGRWLTVKPLLVTRYYALTTAAIALGLIDFLRQGTSATLEAGWTPPEGTR